MAILITRTDGFTDKTWIVNESWYFNSLNNFLDLDYKWNAKKKKTTTHSFITVKALPAFRRPSDTLANLTIKVNKIVISDIQHVWSQLVSCDGMA